MATRTWDGGGADNNWNTKENWSDDTTPITDDEVVFDATSTKACTINASVSLGTGSISVGAGYTNTITQSSAVTCTNLTLSGGTWTGSANVTCSGNLTVSGSTVTLGGNSNVTGALSRTSGSLTLSSGTTTVSGGFSGDFTHNSGTVVLADTQTVNTGSSFNNLTISASTDTITLSANVTVTGEFKWTTTTTLNGSHLYLEGSITGTSGQTLDGNTPITIQGSASQTCNGANGRLKDHAVVFNKGGGTLTFSGTTIFQGGSVTYTAGTIDAVTNSSTVSFWDTMTVNTDGIDFFNVGTSAANTQVVTLSSDITSTGTFTFSRGGSTNFNEWNGNSILIEGHVTWASASRSKGTSLIEIVGTGNQTFTGNGTTSTYVTLSPIEINKPSGTLTMASIFPAGGRLEWIQGTVDASACTLGLNPNAEIYMPSPAITFAQINHQLNTICELRSNIACTGDIGGGNAGTFTYNTAGGEKTVSFGGNWNINNYTMTQTGTGVRFIANGIGNQTITGNAGSAYCNCPFEINKPSGILYFANSTGDTDRIKISNGFNWIAGTISAGTSKVLLGGTVNAPAASMSFYDVDIYSSVAANTSLSSAIDVNGTLRILSSASSILNTNGNQINVAGNWTKGFQGTFTHGNGNVVFDGAGTSVITGTNTFYDLTCITPSKRLEFESGVTQTIANTLTLNGQAAGTRIVLARNGGSGTDRFTFNVATPQTVYYVDVANSNASTSDIFNRMGRDSGNTDRTEATPHWVFSNAKYISVEMGQK